MRQNISDKGSNIKYLAYAGAFILLLLIIGNYSKTINNSPKNSSNNYIYEWQAESHSSNFIMEDADEVDIDKEVSDCYIIQKLFENIDWTDSFVSDIFQLISSKSKDYFQSDLSPPFYI